MPHRDFPLSVPERVADRYAAWVDAPGEPATARPAATVMLVRDAPGFGAAPPRAGVPGAGGVEVFVQVRVASMAFAPNRVVFPGGGVDAADGADLPWAGPAPSEWATRLGTTAEHARGLVAAAIRELFEECGVLLAGPDGHTVLGPVPQELHTARDRVARREVTLAETLREHGLVARTDLLGYAAHWITPEVEPRRYDTRFFAALLPSGQVADGETSEAERAEWARPADLLRDVAGGLMPPTRVCLERLAEHPSAASVVGARDAVATVTPRPVRAGDGWAMRAEWA